MMGLTKRQAAALKFISRFQQENNGMAPSYAEISDALKINSKSGVMRILAGLQERGHIRKPPNKIRMIEVISAHTINISADLHGHLTRAAALTGDTVSRLAERVLWLGLR